MNVLYALSDYYSHNRAGKAYRELIRKNHILVNDLDSADVVILHLEPHDYASIYRRNPVLRSRYVIARCVWEADDLPDSYKRSLEYVQEVWTPSHYCHAVFSRYHPRVFCMPHVIDRDMTCSEVDRDSVRRRIGYSSQYVYYLAITRLGKSRKNTHALIKAFQKHARRMPNARLIIKSADISILCSDPRIIILAEKFTWPQITALYECADIYVSPHHAEGWGWTLADALLFKKPTIATGYSGNLEFMNHGNSFLLDYTEEHIHWVDIYPPFTRRMKWAYPVQSDLEEKLLFLYDLKHDAGVAVTVGQKTAAAADISRFTPGHVHRLIHNRFDDLTSARPSPLHYGSLVSGCELELTGTGQ